MKKIFALLVSCLLLLVAAVGYAAVPYGAYRYTCDKGDKLQVLNLFYTPEGVFASVNVAGGSEGDMFPCFSGAGRVQNDTLSLENYLIERSPDESVAFKQPLDCEINIKHKNQVVLRPSVNARELGVTTISESDIAGSYSFEPGEIGPDERLALVYLQSLHPLNTELDLRDSKYSLYFSTVILGGRVYPERIRDNPYYNVVDVYEGNELVMTYFVHYILWDAYKLPADGELTLMGSNEAVG